MIAFYLEWQEKLEQLPERLSEFTQMRVRAHSSEVNQVIERFNLSELQARKVLINFKVLEQKIQLPIDELLSVLDYNEELLRPIIESHLTRSDNKKDCAM